MSSPLNRRSFLLGTAAAATSAWFLSGCSSSDSGGSAPQASASQIPQADIDKAMDTETTLTFWTWVPDIKNQVEMFMKAYPKIKVDVVNVGQGATLPEAAHRHPGRPGRPRRRPDGVPVHPVLHPG